MPSCCTIAPELQLLTPENCMVYRNSLEKDISSAGRSSRSSMPDCPAVVAGE
uniref:Uncharacterized protein n=1 Tax=Anguilla anguilla TaxID=7936 RepID=A0A0E9VLI1_ANGAN